MRYLTLLLTALASPALANVTPAAIFSEHMVLQSGKPLPVWGWSDGGEQVTVSIAGQSKSVTAGSSGKWAVKLDPIEAGQDLTMTIKGKNTVTITDVIVGEVWLCSGQSNMAWSVDHAGNFDSEKAAAVHPTIRMFFEQSIAAVQPQEKGRGVWIVCSPETVARFSATAYFFGRDLQKAINKPIGLINSSVGGTAIESWTSMEVQKDRADLRRVFEPWEKKIADYTPEKAKEAFEKNTKLWQLAAAKAKKDGKPEPRKPALQGDPRKDVNHPANLYNGKIVPLIGYAIRGAIWYQGESNARIGDLYHKQLSLMITDWRTRWGQGDFPFAWVQLPNFHAKSPSPVTDTGWVMVREGMLRSLALPNTGMAITTDIGEAGNIHPTNKQDVGKRLAMWAIADVYGKGGESSGPLPAGHTVRGNEVVVKFTHAAGLKTRDGQPPIGFAICGPDKQWVKADAKIVGQTVVVSSPKVNQPIAVRYHWVDNPDVNMVNGADIPASPFRTDDWPIEVSN